MIDFLAWWDVMIAWVQRITSLVFLSLVGVAILAYFLGTEGGKRVAVGCFISAVVLLILATYLYNQFGLEIIFPNLFGFFDNLFTRGFP